MDIPSTFELLPSDSHIRGILNNAGRFARAYFGFR
jgi:hypothetical protein